MWSNMFGCNDCIVTVKTMTTKINEKNKNGLFSLNKKKSKTYKILTKSNNQKFIVGSSIFKSKK